MDKFIINGKKYLTEDSSRKSFEPGQMFIQLNSGNVKPILRKQIDHKTLNEYKKEFSNHNIIIYHVYNKYGFYIYSRDEAPDNSYLIID